MRSIGKHSSPVIAAIVYTGVSFLTASIAFVTMPIFTRIMTSAEMGTYNLYNSWNSLIGTFATLSLASGGFMAAMKKYQNNRNQYVSSVLCLTSLVAIITLIFFSFFKDSICKAVGLSSLLIYYMLFGFLVTPAIDFWVSRKRYEYDYLKPSLYTVVSSVISAGISIYCVFYVKSSGLSIDAGNVRVMSSVGITYIFGICMWSYIMKTGNHYVDKEMWDYSLELSIPLIGHTAAMQILSVSDRMMINNIIGKSAVGIYSVLYSLSSISTLVWNSINTSFVPYLFNNIENPRKHKRIQGIVQSIFIIYGMAAFSMSLIAPEVVRVLTTEEYYDAVYLVPPIASGIFMIALSNVYSNILVYYKKTMFIMISSGVAALANVCMNFIAIPKWGYVAAAYTTLIAYSLLGVLQMLVSKKVIENAFSNKMNVYNDKVLLCIAIITVLSIMSCIPLYKFFRVRIIVVLIMGVLAFVFRKKIISIVKITE